MTGLIPVTVLTGFLGSGKTTVLKHWITRPELANTLVVINEFGQIGLDHRLVTQSEDSATVVMDSGCICCTIRADLIQTLEQARWRFAREGKRQFDRVVIETTGLADPAPIIQTLTTQARITRYYQLQSILTTVDLTLGEQTLASHTEAAKQVAMADRLLLTKADLLDAVARDDDSLMLTLRQLNPVAPTTRVAFGDAPVGLVLETARSARVDRPPPATLVGGAGHHHAIGALCLVGTGPFGLEAVMQWQEQVMKRLGEDLFRLKALVEVTRDGGSEWITVQSVQHKAMPVTEVPGNEAIGQEKPMQSQFVLIGRNLSFERVATTLTPTMALSEMPP